MDKSAMATINYGALFQTMRWQGNWKWRLFGFLMKHALYCCIANVHFPSALDANKRTDNYKRLNNRDRHTFESCLQLSFSVVDTLIKEVKEAGSVVSTQTSDCPLSTYMEHVCTRVFCAANHLGRSCTADSSDCVDCGIDKNDAKWQKGRRNFDSLWISLPLSKTTECLQELVRALPTHTDIELPSTLASIVTDSLCVWVDGTKLAAFHTHQDALARIREETGSLVWMAAVVEGTTVYMRARPVVTAAKEFVELKADEAFLYEFEPTQESLLSVEASLITTQTRSITQLIRAVRKSNIRLLHLPSPVTDDASIHRACFLADPRAVAFWDASDYKSAPIDIESFAYDRRLGMIRQHLQVLSLTNIVLADYLGHRRVNLRTAHCGEVVHYARHQIFVAPFSGLF